jgi:eukaryotic translation initiation factor 2C
MPIYSARPDQVVKALKNHTMDKSTTSSNEDLELLLGKDLELLLSILPDNNGHCLMFSE